MSLYGLNPKHNYDVRVASESRGQIGIMRLQEAIRMAEQEVLDLVSISPTAKPPVVQIMDYGKHLYNKKRAEKDAKKKQSVIVLKEIKFNVGIEKNDLNTKIQKVRECLREGYRVKLVVTLRGRQLAHREIAAKMLNSAIEDLSDVSNTDTAVSSEARSISVILKCKK